MPSDTREKILQAAFTVLSRQGYGNTSIKEIAEEAGVAQGLVHYYFKSKQLLVLEVLNFVCKKMELGDVGEAGALEAFEQTKQLFRDSRATNALYVQLIGVSLHDAEIGAGVREFVRTERAHVEDIARQVFAERELDPRLRAKAGASDLVQQTFLEAQRDFGQFRGGTEDELLAWLRRLLLNNLANFARQYRGTRKRAVNREVRLSGPDSQGASGGNIAGAEPTPSSAFQRDEEYEALQGALVRLPDEYRQVISWRYEEDLSFDEIGVRLGRTANAARKLWLRAVERLEREMEGPK